MSRKHNGNGNGAAMVRNLVRNGNRMVSSHVHNDATNGDGTAEAPSLRIVIADEHPIVRVGIMHELAEHPDILVVAEASDGDEALEQCRRLVPDVLLLDIGMAGMAPIELLRQIGDFAHPPHTLVFTSCHAMEHVLATLKAGATGYLLKNEVATSIIVALRSVARGDVWLSSVVASGLVDHMVRSQLDGTSVEAMLSAREQEVLHLLAEGKDNAEISNVLHITGRTVRYHLRNIYSKIGVERRGEAIVWSIRQGFHSTFR
jgi:NarL family two-component system response regulator LiaR